MTKKDNAFFENSSIYFFAVRIKVLPLQCLIESDTGNEKNLGADRTG